MRITAGVLTLLALTSLTGCGITGSSGNADAAESEAAVPAGVQEQYETLADEVAERGGRTTSGEWEIAYIVEAAEPWFEVHHGAEKFREPTGDETHHIEIIPTEKASGRIVPDVPVTVEVLDADGKVVERQALNFYHSTFYHYANNFTVPEEGTYTLRATLGVPDFMRHGEEGEKPALSEGATVTFEDVQLAPDQS